MGKRPRWRATDLHSQSWWLPPGRAASLSVSPCTRVSGAPRAAGNSVLPREPFLP